MALTVLFWLGSTQRVSAAIELEADEEGNIVWKTVPTMATTGIKWRTQGFLIYAKKTDYGYPLKSGEPYGKILVDDKRVSVETKPDKTGKNVTTFTVDADYVKSVLTSNKKLYAQFQENIENGKPYLYFNNFFQSYRVNSNGSQTILTSNMYDIDSIRNNQWWANKHEWDSGYFNIRVPYKVTGNVHVKLSDENGNALGTPTGVFNGAGVEILELKADGKKRKNPALAFYSEKYKPLGICLSKDKVYVGEKVTVSLPETVEWKGKTYALYRSYYYQESGDGVKKADTKLKTDRTGTITKKIKLGLTYSMVVGRYKEVKEGPPDPPDPPGPPDPPDPPNPPGVEIEEPEEIEGEFTEREPTAVIGSGTLEQSPFDVEQGIPTTEELYTHVLTPRYLAGYRFTKKVGSKTYTAKGTITWNLTWTEGEGETATVKTATQTVTYTAPVERSFAYWEITNLEVYGLSFAQVQNGALPFGSITLTPNGYSAPAVAWQHDAGADSHIRQPEEIGQVLDLGTRSHGESSPPAYDASSELNAMVGECKVKNDRLQFDGKTILNDAWTSKSASRPAELNTEPEDVAPKTLYASQLMIPAELANGIYESAADVTYGRIAAVNPTRDASLTLPVEEVNPVIVHTPVVCEPVIENQKNWCQMLYPMQGAVSLILHTSFQVSLPTVGEHLGIPGYGFRDYGKYTASRQVKFPFDTYKELQIFVPAGTWTEVGDRTSFYLPPWVTEQSYLVEFRSIAINAAANNGIDSAGLQANLNRPEYVARNQILVEISGSLYEFSLYDISDYPIWEPVFRTPQGTTSGFVYKVGTKDERGRENGQDAAYTLPLIAGSHPSYPNIGVLKTGYWFRFRMKTIGDYDGRGDYIQIKPRFFYVSEDGKERQEVDLYYTERLERTGEREQLIRVGSRRDKNNLHTIWTGDPAMSLPEYDLETTARIRGVDLESWKQQKREIFTFETILLPESLMTFTRTPLPVEIRLAGKNEEQVAEHMQTWYGSYYLPREIHVCPKGFDLEEWCRRYGLLDYREEFWLRDGYVMVQFDIETIQDDKRYLSYQNQENAARGYCNMWKLEGAVSSKSDYCGGVFSLQDGDVLFYDTDKSIGNDYQSEGIY